VNAREHQRRRSFISLDRHATEAFDTPGLSFHDAKPLTTNIRKQNECRERVHLSMSLDRSLQVDIGNDLPVDDDERLAFKKLSRVIERTARPENYRFFNVMQLDAKTTAITQRTPHRLRPVMKVHHDLIDSIRGEILGDITDEWFS